MSAAPTLSLAAARRIALAAQGLAAPRDKRLVTPARLLRLVDRLSLHQIDSVNVLARAHYLPAFSRLGAYPMAMLDELAWGRRPRLFEYWAHEASLLPLPLQPLLRWRMTRAERGEGMWGSLKPYAGPLRAEADAVLKRIEADGPLAASDLAPPERPGPRTGGWWGWSDAKRALEYLFWSGRVGAATRRASFERVYDLSERVIPAVILAQPTPDEADAHRALLLRASRALGIANARDLRDYFRLSPTDAHPRIAELAEAGALIPVHVAGARDLHYLAPAARRPRRAEGRALLSPFDPLVWERTRTERLFAMRYRIEIYTPAAKRVHGYYVLPFLLRDRLAARVDLKADRKARLLRVEAAHLEPDSPADTAEELGAELRTMARWLDLNDVVVADRGDLAGPLRSALATG